jgi:hypothetical protein
MTRNEPSTTASVIQGSSRPDWVKPLSCPFCDAPVPPSRYNSGILTPCLSCGTPLRIDAFPALVRGADPLTIGDQAASDEATCFYHSEKKAEAACELCGRFICALCEIELNGKRMCPACLHAGKVKGKIKNLDRERTLYDSIALSLSLYPIITIWFTLVTAPVALYMAIRHWNSPLSVTRRRKTRFVLAMIFSGCEIVAWVAILVYIIRPR